MMMTMMLTVNYENSYIFTKKSSEIFTIKFLISNLYFSTLMNRNNNNIMLQFFNNKQAKFY